MKNKMHQNAQYSIGLKSQLENSSLFFLSSISFISFNVLNIPSTFFAVSKNFTIIRIEIMKTMMLIMRENPSSVLIESSCNMVLTLRVYRDCYIKYIHLRCYCAIIEFFLDTLLF